MLYDDTRQRHVGKSRQQAVSLREKFDERALVVLVRNAEVYAEWGGVVSTPLLRQYHITTVMGHESTTIDITSQAATSCSRGSFTITHARCQRRAPDGALLLNTCPTRRLRHANAVQSDAGAWPMYEVHVQPDFAECDEMAEAASVLANLQAQHKEGSTFCNEGTCEHYLVDMTQSIAQLTTRTSWRRRGAS